MGSDVMTTLVHPDDLPRVLEHLNRFAAIHAVDESISTVEYRMRHRDGHWCWLFSREVVFMRNSDGQPQQLLGIAQDITERKHAEEALRESEQRLQAIFDNAAVGIGLTDNAGQSIIINARGAQQLGYTHEELARLSSMEMTHPDDQAETAERMQQLLRGEIQGYRIEKRYFRKDGSIFWADLSVSAVYDDDGQIAYLLGIVVDITERKQLEQQLHQANVLLQEQAIRDSLTRLYNRRYLDEALPREFQRAERHSQSIGIIMIDVDHFKRFNDTYGHDAGDALLRAVGVFLQHHTRSEDIVCRYGGEEFTVVLPGASHEDASQRAEELRAGIQALVVTHQGQKMKGITASFGIAIFPAHGTTAEALVSAADQALYQAKYNGRNQVAVADNVRDYHKVGIDSS
jgi:diguanylate cyclase (GGDEF)-like protein/PAS domain S-box-containing protein